MGKKYDEYKAAIEYLKEYDKLQKVLQRRKEMLSSNAVPSEYKSLAKKIIEDIKDLEFSLGNPVLCDAYENVNPKAIEKNYNPLLKEKGMTEAAKEELANGALVVLEDQGIGGFRKEFDGLKKSGEKITDRVASLLLAIERSKSQASRATAGSSSQPPLRGAVTKSGVPKGLRTGRGPKK